MTFPNPSPEEMRELIVALGHALFPDQNFGSRFSYHGKQATFFSGATSQLHFHTLSAESDLHPLTAGDGKPINDWGSALGLPRKAATSARKSSAGRIRGLGGSTINPGTQLRHEQTGLLFQISNGSIITLPGIVGADSFFDADIAGIDTGTQTRLDKGQVLVFVGGPPSGCQSKVVLQLNLDEDGFDDEQFGAYRARVLEIMSSTPSGGSAGDFERWAKQSLASVVQAYAYPNRAGLGTIDIAAFHSGTGSARSLTLAERDAVKAFIQTLAPFQVAGVGGPLRILSTTASPTQVKMRVSTNGIPAFRFDFTGQLIVLSYNATTRELRFTTPLPTALRAGHRIIIEGVVGGSGQTAQDGRQYKIEVLSGADRVILEKSPPTNPAANDIVWPGGPLVDRVRDAVRGHLNGETVFAGRGGVPIPASAAAPLDPDGPSLVGLDELAQGIGPANPDGRFGKWTGDILHSTLFGIAKFTAGVRNVFIDVPSADLELADFEVPNDASVPFITPSVVIVREE